MKIHKTDLISLLDNPWKEVMKEEFSKPYMKELNNFLNQEIALSKKIYPEKKDIFKCFNSTPFDEVKVIILGQDPYHGLNQAEGLSFSVKEGEIIPPSLKNIHKEVENNMNTKINTTKGSLIKWANQGVLLLNSILTVQEGLPGSHSNKGWEKFTDEVISRLNKKDSLVFMFWGKYAKTKSILIDNDRHLVLESPHPSPLSAYKGFIGNKHFSTCNKFLLKNRKKKIDWIN